MEEECIFDIAFLLGIDFLSEHIYKCKKDIIYLLLQVGSKFTRALVKIIENLVVVQKLELVSAKLTIPVNLTDLFLYKVAPSGVCNICDKYFIKLLRHLNINHNLSKPLVQEHANLFKSTSYFYQPASYKSLELEKSLDENPYFSRTQVDKIIKLNDVKVGIATSYFASCTDNTNNMLCVECGKIITKKNRPKHYALHRRADSVECAKCGSKLFRRQLNAHMKQCTLSVPAEPEIIDL